MSNAKKLPAHPASDYKIAAAQHRAKVLANRVADQRELVPTDGKLHVVLSDEVLSANTKNRFFGYTTADTAEIV